MIRLEPRYASAPQVQAGRLRRPRLWNAFVTDVAVNGENLAPSAPWNVRATLAVALASSLALWVLVIAGVSLAVRSLA